MTAGTVPGQPAPTGPQRPDPAQRQPGEQAERQSGEPAQRPTGEPAQRLRDESAERPTGELAELCRQADRLLTSTAGPVRRIHLRSGDTVLEIEWHGPTGSAEPGGPAGHAPAVRTTAAPTDVADRAGRPAEGDGDAGRRTVVAPMVGTYYQAAEPGGTPFVEVGDKVEPGQVVGIVEAMKLMNEVVADQAGRVAEVLVRDGEPVEFGQPLIALLPA